MIQSIPSPKAEPFKQWMAQVASTRLDQLQDPELSIQQAVADYRRLGHSVISSAKAKDYLTHDTDDDADNLSNLSNGLE